MAESVLLSGTAEWTQKTGFRVSGTATGSWDKDGDRKLRFHVSDGEFRYNVVIEVNDVGTWTCPDDGSQGGLTGGFAPRTPNSYEVNGIWIEGGEEYDWQLRLQKVKKLPVE